MAEGPPPPHRALRGRSSLGRHRSRRHRLADWTHRPRLPVGGGLGGGDRDAQAEHAGGIRPAPAQDMDPLSEGLLDQPPS